MMGGLKARMIFTHERGGAFNQGSANEAGTRDMFKYLEPMQTKRQKIADLESKLQQEADEMQSLLKEKNWYQKYANKIANEEAEK